MDPLPASVRTHLRAGPVPWFASDAWRPELSSARDDGRWTPLPDLADASWWAGASRAYADRIGTRHLAPGAACALQHYAGRMLAVVVTVWTRTGRAMSLRAPDWWAYVDRHGATTGVRHVERILGDPADATELGRAVVDHLAPLVDAARACSRLTPAVAWGGPAASVAGAFGRVHRSAEPARRPALIDAARRVLGELEDAAGRPLVDLVVEADEPALVLQHRATCCLIRLGRDASTCATCPRLSAPERVRRQHAHHRAVLEAGA